MTERDDWLENLLNDPKIIDALRRVDPKGYLQEVTTDTQIALLEVIVDYTHADRNVVDNLRAQKSERKKLHPSDVIRQVEKAWMGTDTWVNHQAVDVSGLNTATEHTGNRAAWGMFSELNTFLVMRGYIGAVNLEQGLDRERFPYYPDRVKMYDHYSMELSRRQAILIGFDFSYAASETLYKRTQSPVFNYAPMYLQHLGQLEPKLGPILQKYGRELGNVRGML